MPAIGFRPPQATDENLVRVRQGSGASLTYDPKRLHGVTLYRETTHAPLPSAIASSSRRPTVHAANRELGTIKAVESSGQMELAMDSGRDGSPPTRSTSTSGLRLRCHQPQ